MKQRKDGRWVKKITLPDGTVKFFYSKADTEKKAIKDIEQQLLTFSQKKEKGMLLEKVVDDWEREHFAEIGYNTACKYSNCIKKIKEYFKGEYISNIECADVNLFLKDLAKRNYARDTVSINKSVLSQIFDYAIKNRFVTFNPCSVIDIPKGLKQETREPATPEEIQIILKSVNKFFGLYACMAVLTGMRREELLALTDKDIDFEKKQISVNKAVIFVNNQPQITVPKTKSSIRNIFLPTVLEPYLKHKKGYIFGNGEKPMSQTAFRRAYDRYRKETALKVTSHQLRHAYATILYDAEVDVKTAQKQLGHSKTSTTQDIYTHIWQDRQQKQMNKMNEYIEQML
ncbi:MAG: site-specific integrase [Clostridia bacterium]|nr:site-specific integrase [Clostridia bacterium]